MRMPSRRATKNKDFPKESLYHTSSYSLSIATSNIPNAGKGVFTNEFIPKDTIIDEYHGDVYEISFASSRYFLEITPGCGIDAFNYPRCYMAMVNDVHGTNYKVNCMFVIDIETRRAFIKSITDIHAQCELYVSYGNEYWHS
jgi:uncharacterized protein